MVKALQIRSDPKLNAQECCLKVSLLPLRFNIDQDSLLFLVQFFSEISGENKEGNFQYIKITLAYTCCSLSYLFLFVIFNLAHLDHSAIEAKFTDS